MRDELVTVAVYRTLSEAELAKLKLDSEGIRAAVITQSPMAPGLHPLVPFQLFQCRVMVQSVDADKAAFVLEEAMSPAKADPFLGLIHRSGEARFEITYHEPREQAFLDVRRILERIGSIQDIDEKTRQVDVIIKVWGTKYPLRVRVWTGNEEGYSRLAMTGNPIAGGKLIKELEKI